MRKYILLFFLFLFRGIIYAQPHTLSSPTKGEYSSNVSIIFTTYKRMKSIILLLSFVVISNLSYAQNNIYQVNKNVGIGTTNPLATLDLNGSLILPGSLSNQMLRPAIGTTPILGEISGYNGSALAYDDGFLRLSAGAGSSWNVKSYIDLSGYSTVPDMNRNIVMGTSGVERLRIDISGNVGIGTANPREKLSVNGIVHAKEVKVDLIGWPDYVFDPEYKLLDLAEVKAYIEENRHLPNVPSAEDITKNGVKLGEINSVLLKKIEELTLYLIKSNQAINAQDQKMLAQQEELKAQREMILRQQELLNKIMANK